MRQSGNELVDKLGITKRMKVLDLGCGDGTTAIPIAKLGADVLGVDIASNLVEAGNIRSRKEGLTHCTFQEGDACNLRGLEDESFDMVISIFGAMFASKPYDVAKEMVRVTKPGGKIIMGNWIPGEATFVARLLNISSSYSPPPSNGFISPMTWGVENNVIDRFGQAGIKRENITMVKDTYTFIAPYSSSEFLLVFKNFYGPTMNAYEAAGNNGKEEFLHKELDELFNSQNQSESVDRTSIPATYLRVSIQC